MTQAWEWCRSIWVDRKRVGMGTTPQIAMHLLQSHVGLQGMMESWGTFWHVLGSILGRGRALCLQLLEDIIKMLAKLKASLREASVNLIC